MNFNHFSIFLGSGTIIPILVSLISSPRWPSGVRAVLALVISVGVALWETRAQWIPGDWWTNAALVFGAVSMAYNGILKHVGLPALERGTAEAWTSFWQRVFNRAEPEPESDPTDIVLRITKLDSLLAKKVISKEQYDQRLAQLRNEALEQI